MFVETQSWQVKNSSTNDEENMAEIKATVEHLISVFRAPLESRGACNATIQEEVEEAIEYTRRYLTIGIESYRKI